MCLEAFIGHYITTALWASTDNSDPETGGEPLDDSYGPDDLSPDALAKMTADCASFYNDPSNYEGLRLWNEEFGDDTQAGHDFWLTRNRHGAGFWDRFYGEANADKVKLGNDLTKAAQAYGEVDLYIGDDGKIHHA